MSNRNYSSILKHEMTDYIKLRKSQGFINPSLHIIDSLDKYLVSQNIADKSLLASTVDGWIAYERNDKKASSVNGYIGFYKSFAKYINHLGIDVFIPDYLRINESYVPYIFTEEEITAIFNAADNIEKTRHTASKLHFPLLLRILYGSGLRLGEALALKKSDVDLEKGVLFIGKAKNNKDRLVPIDSSLNELLSLYCKRFMANKGNDTFMFARERGDVNKPRCKRWAQKHFDRVLETAGIDKPILHPHHRSICMHCLRHTFVVHSIRRQELAGIDNYDAAPSISPYLGHYNLKDTQRYLHMTAENSKDIIAATNEYSKGMFPKVNAERREITPQALLNEKPLKATQEKVTNECSKGMFPEVPR